MAKVEMPDDWYVQEIRFTDKSGKQVDITGSEGCTYRCAWPDVRREFDAAVNEYLKTNHVRPAAQ